MLQERDSQISPQTRIEQRQSSTPDWTAAPPPEEHEKRRVNEGKLLAFTSVRARFPERARINVFVPLTGE
ncbi:MAG: hypothetical protein FJ319_00195 [SAR202 cluster bacterium]|nr:hypothetical protein [SAR202 cluster bacterium]